MSLVLLRHAKSCWDQPTLEDWQRPLATRGINTLPKVLTQLQQWHLTPTQIICSDAVRAVATAKVVAASYPNATYLQLPELYMAKLHDWNNLLYDYKTEANQSDQCQLWVGHNPAMQQLVEQLSGIHIIKFRTAAMAWLSADGVRLFRTTTA
ncbi:SixA phosphatase family protein [Ferrimonas lipolytica]|uniref:Phosphohistidine phosphatase n=1 Tax=Ferrimonas lipolytica TaxID=2724191 RepID=A0A6H1UBT7_9GAMM|nr:histidine phosphatase family protein [Ferrimonas lipolytica]QIZ76109.1 hypothetical protein HER31_03910 [Ferrimonas lipolytica]